MTAEDGQALSDRAREDARTSGPTVSDGAALRDSRDPVPDHRVARIVVGIMSLALGVLLVGYMFLGRGFAHIAVGPVYIGDVVLTITLVGAAYLVVFVRVRRPLNLMLILIAGFMLLGAVRTAPYLGDHGTDALRDGVLWGYAAFAFVVYVLVDGVLAAAVFRAYGWVAAAFALWLPISWNLFVFFSRDIDPTRPGATVPLIFFKAGDMAVHIVGAIAFLILGALVIRRVRTLLWRLVLFLPLLGIAFISGTANRGALLTTSVGLAAVFALAPRSRNWLPFVAAMGVLALGLVIQSVIPWPAVSAPSAATASPAATVVASAGATDEPASVGRSTLLNPSFELAATNDGRVRGWTARGATAEIVERGAKHQERFVALRNELGPYAASLTSERFRLDEGPDLGISAWAMSITGRPIMEIYVIWYDRQGREIASEFVKAGGTQGIRRWREVSGILSSPDQATSAEIRFFEARGMSTMGIDHVALISGDLVLDPAPAPTPERRSASIEQMIDNILSVFEESDDPGLEGTKQFRLAWWGAIVDYTVFGEYFWSGKGFGVNLADDDGFQSTADGSLRAPHNSHLTVLARMGVPGIVLWMLLQGAFAVALVRTMLSSRRAGDGFLAAVAAWTLVYWLAMMVNTSFDPYLEGPQGGIWFWATMGFGMAIVRFGQARDPV